MLANVVNQLPLIFPPWVGPEYGQSDIRLLIVGESHYGEPDEDDSKATATVVQNWQNRSWSIRYLTVAARLVTGLQAHEIDREHALEETAFYNYVQALMPDISVRPTADQVRSSEKAFRQTLELLRPSHVLVTGKTLLWQNMPASDGSESAMRLADRDVSFREYKWAGGKALTMVIPHLSRLSAGEWGPIFKQFMQRKSLED